MEKIIFLNLEHMKILSDQIKIDILNCFENEMPLTVKEISESLKISYSSLNYHIKILEKAGIIEVVETKVKSGIIEKYYLPSAKEFRIDKRISIFEEDEESYWSKNNLRRKYEDTYKELIKDYQFLVENLDKDNLTKCVFLNSVVFLDEEGWKNIKTDIRKFIASIEKKYSLKEDGLDVYGIGNFLIPKKNIYGNKLNDSHNKNQEKVP